MDLTEVKIGDRVYGKKTGGLTPATVVGWLPGRFHPNSKLSTRWDELYPNWRDKHIVYAEFDEPTRSCTFEEYKEQTLDRIMESTDEFIVALRDNKELFSLFLRNQYDNTVEPTTRICYPIDDIEVI